MPSSASFETTKRLLLQLVIFFHSLARFFLFFPPYTAFSMISLRFFSFLFTFLLILAQSNQIKHHEQKKREKRLSYREQYIVSFLWVKIHWNTLLNCQFYAEKVKCDPNDFRFVFVWVWKFAWKCIFCFRAFLHFKCSNFTVNAIKWNLVWKSN